MSMNFPSPAIPGQVYTPVGGYSYVFLDGVWRIVQDAQSILTADTRNRIVNGAMQISQENGDTAATGVARFGADQWATYYPSSSVVPTTQRVQSATPNGSRDRYRLTITTADAALAATDYLSIRQMVEGLRIVDFGYGTAAARQSVVRFGFKGPAGTYSFRLLNGDANRAYVQNFTISAGQANTDTTQTFVVPGTTSGLFGSINNIGFYFDVCLACGTTYQAPATGWSDGAFLGTAANSNGMTPVGAVYELFDVGLYLDPLATGVPPRWQMPDEAEELRACQRYWQQTGSTHIQVYANTAGAAGVYTLPFKCDMRAAPALTVISVGTPVNVATYINDNLSTQQMGRCGATATAAGAILFNNRYFAFSARM